MCAFLHSLRTSKHCEFLLVKPLEIVTLVFIPEFDDFDGDIFATSGIWRSGSHVRMGI